VDSWSQLPEALRAGIVAMVRAAYETGRSASREVSSAEAAPTLKVTARSIPDMAELRAMAAKVEPRQLRKLKADLSMIGTALRRADLLKDEITRILELETARRLKRLTELPAKRKRRQDRRRYKDTQSEKAMRRWEQAQGGSVRRSERSRET
jgi:hypothetical protein